MGNLILKANSEDPDISQAAFNKLLPLLFSMLGENPAPAILPPKIYTQLLMALEKMEAAKVGDKESHEEALGALNRVLVLFYQLARSKDSLKSGTPHQKLFKQAMISGAEIFKALDRLLALPPTAPNDKQKASRQELLDLVSKLEALITNPGNKNLFSDSIYQIAEQNKAILEAAKVPGFQALTPEQQDYFVEFIKPKKFILNEDLQERWAEFVLTCCQSSKDTQMLAHMRKFYIDSNMESDFLNDCFVRHWEGVTKQAKAQAKAILHAMEKESLQTAKELAKIDHKPKKEEASFPQLPQTSPLTPVRQVLESWQRRIKEWANPKNFDTLFNDFNQQLVPLIERLSITPDMQPLTKKTVLKMVYDLMEIMDNSIKALTGSVDYADKRQQVQRFAKMLEPYFELMCKWVNLIPAATLARWAGVGQIKLYEDLHKGINIKLMLDNIKAKFNALKKETDPKQLEASPSVSIAALTVDSASDFFFSFSYDQQEQFFTLETLFSLFHQNIIASLAAVGQDTSIPVAHLPKDIQPLIEALESIPPREEQPGGRGGEGKLTFVRSEHRFPYLNLHYNIPLAHHSAKCSVQYDQVRKRCQVKLTFIGRGSKGWQGICDLAQMDALFMGCKFKIHRQAQGDVMIAPGKFNFIDSAIFSFEMDVNQLNLFTESIKKAVMAYSDSTLLGFTIGRDDPGWYARNLFSRLDVKSVEEAREIMNKVLVASKQERYKFVNTEHFKIEFLKFLKRFSDDKEINAGIKTLQLEAPAPDKKLMAEKGLIEAIQKNNIADVRRYLDEGASAIFCSTLVTGKTQTMAYLTPLYVAIEARNADIVKLLLAQKDREGNKFTFKTLLDELAKVISDPHGVIKDIIRGLSTGSESERPKKREIIGYLVESGFKLDEMLVSLDPPQNVRAYLQKNTEYYPPAGDLLADFESAEKSYQDLIASSSVSPVDRKKL